MSIAAKNVHSGFIKIFLIPHASEGWLVSSRWFSLGSLMELQLNGSCGCSHPKAWLGQTSESASSFLCCCLASESWQSQGWPGISPSLHITSTYSQLAHSRAFRGVEILTLELAFLKVTFWGTKGRCKASGTFLTNAWKSCSVTATELYHQQ